MYDLEQAVVEFFPICILLLNNVLLTVDFSVIRGLGNNFYFFGFR